MSDFGVNIGKVPKITWGTGFVNTLELGRPVLNVEAASIPLPLTKITPNKDHSVTGWSVGHQQVLKCLVKAIPANDEVTEYGVTMTGWEGDTGWQGFLEYCFTRSSIRWFPDRTAGTYITSYLTQPWQTPPEPGWNLRWDVQLELQSVDPTTPFQGY